MGGTQTPKADRLLLAPRDARAAEKWGLRCCDPLLPPLLLPRGPLDAAPRRGGDECPPLQLRQQLPDIEPIGLRSPQRAPRASRPRPAARRAWRRGSPRGPLGSGGRSTRAESGRAGPPETRAHPRSGPSPARSRRPRSARAARLASPATRGSDSATGSGRSVRSRFPA